MVLFAKVSLAQGETASIQNRSDVFTLVEEMPEFPGGNKQLQKYLIKQLLYPVSAKETKTEGICYVQVIIDSIGEVKKTELIKGIENCSECDREAIRVIRSMPRWKPGKIEGKKVNCYFTIPVKFKL